MSLPLRKILRATPTNTTHPLWDMYSFDLECGHRKRQRIHIDQDSPQELRCPSCRDGKPQEFDPKAIDVSSFYE